MVIQIKFTVIFGFSSILCHFSHILAIFWHVLAILAPKNCFFRYNKLSYDEIHLKMQYFYDLMMLGVDQMQKIVISSYF